MYRKIFGGWTGVGGDEGVGCPDNWLLRIRDPIEG